MAEGLQAAQWRMDHIKNKDGSRQTLSDVWLAVYNEKHTVEEKNIFLDTLNRYVEVAIGAGAAGAIAGGIAGATVGSVTLPGIGTIVGAGACAAASAAYAAVIAVGGQIAVDIYCGIAGLIAGGNK